MDFININVTARTSNLLVESVVSMAIENVTPQEFHVYANGLYKLLAARTVMTIYADDAVIQELEIEPVGVGGELTIYRSADSIIRSDLGLPNVIFKYRAHSLARCPSLPACLHVS